MIAGGYDLVLRRLLYNLRGACGQRKEVVDLDIGVLGAILVLCRQTLPVCVLGERERWGIYRHTGKIFNLNTPLKILIISNKIVN